MPGGRPRNNWTASRERKLARLYTLSNLEIEEIQRLLKEQEFNPSLSDVQKKLRVLLPKDYGKDYRRYRPASDDQARLRFDRIKHSIDNRVMKNRGSNVQSQAPHNDDVESPSVLSYSSKASIFEGPSSAFVNYSASLSTIPEQYVSMDSLDLAMTIQQPLPRAENQETAYQSSNSGSAFSAQGYLLIPDSVTWPESTQEYSSLEHGSNNVFMSDVSETNIQQILTHNIDEAHKFQYDAYESADAFISQDSASESMLPYQPLSHSHSQTPSILSRATSIRSLSKRLVNGYSFPHIEQIASVLSLSSFNSLTTSLISLVGFMSPWGSTQSSSSLGQCNKVDRTIGRALEGKTYLFHKAKVRARDSQKKIWDDLIDETQLAKPVRVRPSYAEISLKTRPCCGLKTMLYCKICGFSPIHYLARLGGPRTNLESEHNDLFKPQYINKKDDFGNTPLHFTAAIRVRRIPVMRALIKAGANIRARNSSGETFLHALPVTTTYDMSAYIDLLNILSRLDFPFSDRDCHGRTIAHVIFETLEPKEISIEVMDEIFQILNPDPSSVDNFGHRFDQKIVDHIVELKARHESTMRLEALLDRYRKSTVSAIDCHLMMTGEDIKAWYQFADKANHANWVDSNGNTPLLTIVKSWPHKTDERKLTVLVKDLVDLGGQINMRDGRGDTALTIAVCRGFRPVVKTLLSNGANPNTRNYNDISTLEMAGYYLKRAAAECTEKSKTYCHLLSCMVLLVDHGGTEQPTVHDEWGFHVSPSERVGL